MTPDDLRALQAQYSVLLPTLEAFRIQAEALVSVLATNTSADVYQVSSRCKSVESFCAKADRKHYEDPIQDMVDKVGIRVVMLFDDDIDLIVSKLQLTFTPVESPDDKRGDKTSAYKSVHLTLRIGSQRTALPEWSAFRDVVFEVQVRSLLMHAWAEVSHRLFYKFNERLPDKDQQTFEYAMSALSLVDNNFNHFRNISREMESGEAELES